MSAGEGRAQPCECTPGSEDNGWHETRCDNCVRIEMAEWGHVIAWTRDRKNVERLTKGNQ